MTVHGIVCKKCNTFIFSRQVHDFHRCPCEACAIDGGQDDYIRIIGKQEDWECGYEMDLGDNVTPVVLFDDYRKGHDKFGTVKLPNPLVRKRGEKC